MALIQRSSVASKCQSARVFKTQTARLNLKCALVRASLRWRLK